MAVGGTLVLSKVVLPIVVGQALRPWVSDKADQYKPWLGSFASFTLLVIIYTTFCNTFCQVGQIIARPPLERGGGAPSYQD